MTRRHGPGAVRRRNTLGTGRGEPREPPGAGGGRRGPRLCRIILIVAGGLLGPGYWLCGSVGGGRRMFGKTPSEVHFTEFVLASVVVVIASWGLLLILGEAMLFALAVFKADDRERYDVYRNLMILWGYVLTLGIPRHFRRLPAQFGAHPDEDDHLARRGGDGSRRGEGSRRPDDGRHPAEPDRRSSTRPDNSARRSPDRSRADTQDHTERYEHEPTRPRPSTRNRTRTEPGASPKRERTTDTGGLSRDGARAESGGSSARGRAGTDAGGVSRDGAGAESGGSSARGRAGTDAGGLSRDRARTESGASPKRE